MIHIHVMLVLCFIARQEPAAVAITNEVQGRPGIQCGSGAIVDVSAGHATVLTVRHLFDVGIGKVSVRLIDGRSFQAYDVIQDELADLALVRMKVGEALPKLRIAADPPAGQERMYQVGYPYWCRFWQIRREGAWEQTDAFIPGTGVRLFEMTFAADPGDSGAAVIRAADRCLVGVTFLGRGSGATKATGSVCIGPTDILRLMNKAGVR